MNAKVSVIIPVYNSEKYIGQCLESILSQTYKNIELILIDDGSTDKSKAVILKYASRHKNIFYYYQENAGVASARNEGVIKSTGEYIAFADNDDIVDNEYIEHMIKNIGNNDIAICGYVRQTYNGKVIFKRALQKKPLAKYVQIACWGKLFKRSFLIDNKIKFLKTPVGEDIYFSCLCYDKTDKITVLPYCDYHWMYNDNSISNTSQKNINIIYDYIKTYDCIINAVSLQNLDEKEYFYYKTAVFLILSSCKKCNKSELFKVYNMIFSNATSNKIAKNKYYNVLHDYGEVKSVKFVVLAFRLLQKLKLAKTFLYIFSKI